MKRCSALVCTLLLAVMLCLPPAGAAEPVTAVGEESTILFTHDLHSHFLPIETGEGESGGYARLKTAIIMEKAKHPDALLLDAGDFSVGSLIQTLYTTQAAELRTMGAMGYDATTIGNHEFDHGSAGFAQMLNAAAESGEKLPAILEANYAVSENNPDREFIQQAMDDYGVSETMLIERGGVTFGLFGLMGVDAHESAPTSGFDLLDAVETAERCAAALKEQGAEFIICLSHSGTGDSLEYSEDEELAKAVDGIDLIISGHTHTTLTAPIAVNGTFIVSAGPYCENLGSVTLQRFSDGVLRVTEYRLIPIDEKVPEDRETAAMVEEWKAVVSAEYLDRYGLTYDQVLTASGFDLDTPGGSVQEGNNLGEFVSDAFLWAVEHLEADAPEVETVSVTASGVLRAPLYAGDITVSEAFDVLSMGVGEDGTSGFPLVGVYLTGKELKAAAEVDASVTPIMPAAQLYMGGIRYRFNTRRMFFDRVMEASLYESPFVREEARSYIEIEDEKLYRVVTGMYSAQMLGTVKEKSMGLLSLEPKMADGSPVTDFNDCILRDADGSEIKEWYALAAYLEQFGEEGVPAWYDAPDGRKEVSRSWNPLELLKNPNWITLAVLALILALILLVVLVVKLVRRGRRRRGYRR